MCNLYVLYEGKSPAVVGGVNLGCEMVENWASNRGVGHGMVFRYKTVSSFEEAMDYLAGERSPCKHA